MDRLLLLITKNWSLGIRLALSFGLLIAILVAVAWLGLEQSRQVEADAKSIQRQSTERLLARDAQPVQASS